LFLCSAWWPRGARPRVSRPLVLCNTRPIAIRRSTFGYVLYVHGVQRSFVLRRGSCADRFVVSVSAFVSTTLFRRSCRQRCSCSSTDPVRQRITTLFLSRLIPTSPLHLVSSARTYAGRRAMRLEGVSGGTARACQETLQDDLPGGDALVLGLIAVMVLERCGRPTEWSVVWRPGPRLGLARRSERATKWAYKCACPAGNVLGRSIDIAEACLEGARGRRVWSECVDAKLCAVARRAWRCRHLADEVNLTRGVWWGGAAPPAIPSAVAGAADQPRAADQGCW